MKTYNIYVNKIFYCRLNVDDSLQNEDLDYWLKFNIAHELLMLPENAITLSIKKEQPNNIYCKLNNYDEE